KSNPLNSLVEQNDYYTSLIALVKTAKKKRKQLTYFLMGLILSGVSIYLIYDLVKYLQFKRETDNRLETEYPQLEMNLTEISNEISSTFFQMICRPLFQPGREPFYLPVSCGSRLDFACSSPNRLRDYCGFVRFPTWKPAVNGADTCLPLFD